MKSIFILFFVAFSQFAPTDEINSAYFNIIKNAVNQNNPTQIYKIFSEETKKQLSLEDFTKQIEVIKDRSGNIIY